MAFKINKASKAYRYLTNRIQNQIKLKIVNKMRKIYLANKISRIYLANKIKMDYKSSLNIIIPKTTMRKRKNNLQVRF